ncbi:hypothetical protein J7T55_005793 [Diaporthe amygdali]|uniref:uncharacterized protein n=1 Tax=Phomopsis amygdali TaxID=1214568 RepID=UPI0022FEC53F|nr:uncharacterized protein J7T55_005793 [Diaporthe amygdali]KAJ0124455.1 hypothetical protein J7T55_005793 [Diaporthe amygdali]
MSSLPAPRRIVTSNLPVPESLSKLDKSEPAVQVVTEEVPLVSEVGGQWFKRSVFTHDRVPTSNAGTDITAKDIPGGGLRLPYGANIRFNEIPPGSRAAMHRTSTTDYNVFLTGSMVLITPAEAYDPDTMEGAGKLQETVCQPGDVVVQRGTMHAWENRSGEWARFISVILGAEETTMERGDGTSQTLADVFNFAL